tara:strand:+ start:4153 stop:5013 length:861 start_codon:yes stop_codon:yes gene_type:complete
MHALIDADIFCYSFGSSKDDEGNPLNWPFVASRLNAQIEYIKEAVGATKTTFFLTGSSNFRVDLASILPYKGGRPAEKPHHYQRVRDYLTNFYKAEVIEGYEADDAMSIAQMQGFDDAKHKARSKAKIDNPDAVGNYVIGYECNETIICSLDKDLMMVPGWHYNWGKDEKTYVSDLDGYRTFFAQCLTGDKSVDNIPGLFGVGKKSASVKYVGECTSRLAMYERVHKEYYDRFGSYWQQFLLENAALLWMLRTDTAPHTCQSEVYELLIGLEDERQYQQRELREEV